MKKITSLVFLLTMLSVAGWSQSIESIKTFVLLGQMDKAKTEIDKAATNAKVMAKPEAYLLKTTIYAALSMSDDNRNKPTGNALASDADAAFEKYKSMEPALTKFKDEVAYQNGPINIYSNFYNQGLVHYNAKQWSVAIPVLKKAIGYSDFLIGEKILQFPIDTNLLILTGVVAEKAKDNSTAALVYGRMVNARIGGADFEGIYQFMVRYYLSEKDNSNFEKVRIIGSELYPESDFFKLDMLDLAVGLKEDFYDKIKVINETLVSDPENYRANELRWSIIYDEILSADEDINEKLSREYTEIKMERSGGVSKIPCKVNGLEMSFIFDTGASNVSLSLTEALFMLKNGKLSSEDIKNKASFQDATGGISEGYIINLKEVVVADHKLTNVEATVVSSLNAPLLLGQSALSMLGKMQIDLSTNTLTISKSPDSKEFEERKKELIQLQAEFKSKLPLYEESMITSLKKCAQLKPEEVKNPLFLGSYYVIKKEEANQARVKFAEELQKKTKPGTKASPADIAKRDQLDKEYQQALEMILEPYLQAAKIYAGKEKLDAREKQQYKNIAGYLAEIYESKKKRASKDPAAAAKWAAEEKKWNDVYEAIK